MRAFAAATESDDQITMGKASILAAAERGWSGQAFEAVELGRRAVAHLQGTEERWWLGYAHYVLAWILVFAGDFGPALEAAAQVYAIGEAIGDRRLRATAAAMNGMVYLHTGEYDLAIDAHRQALELSPDSYETAVFLGFLGGSYLQKGDLAEAIRVLEEAVPLAKRYRSRQVQAWFTCLLADAYLLDRRLETAAALATEALQVAGGAKFQLIVGYAQRVLARSAQARGDVNEAKSYLDEALQTVLSMRSRYWTAQVRLDLAGLAHVQGEQEAATAHLAEAQALFKAARVQRWLERTEQLGREFGAALPSDVRPGSMES
jgi:tetratricopeptide (TPR) repeat protein